MYPYILLIFVVIFYAGNILVGKAINELSPFTITFFRLLIAAIIFLPLGLREAIKYRSTFIKNKKPLLYMMFTGITLFNTFLYGALQYTSPTNVSVLEAVIPTATVILSLFLLNERLRIIQWAGIILSLIGSVWVVMNGNIFQLTAANWNIGDIIMIGAILSWALYSIAVKQYMHFFPHYGVLLIMTALSVVIFLPVVMIEWFMFGLPSFTIPHVAGLLYLGIFPSVLALIFYNRAVFLLSPSKAAVFLNFLPVFTMIGAYFLLNETITAAQIFGTAAVICGVWFTTQEKKILQDSLSNKQKIFEEVKYKND